MYFYFVEIVAIAICWLFYCEFRWVLDRKMRKVCSNDYISKRCITFSDKLFFTPVSGKVNFGVLYYINIIFFFLIILLSGFHVLLGWIGALNDIIRIITTVVICFLGLIGAACSAGSTEEICTNKNIVSKKQILAIQTIVFLSEIIVVLAYLYVAWVFIP